MVVRPLKGYHRQLGLAVAIWMKISRRKRSLLRLVGHFLRDVLNGFHGGRTRPPFVVNVRRHGSGERFTERGHGGRSTDGLGQHKALSTSTKHQCPWNIRGGGGFVRGQFETWFPCPLQQGHAYLWCAASCSKFPESTETTVIVVKAAQRARHRLRRIRSSVRMGAVLPGRRIRMYCDGHRSKTGSMQFHGRPETG